MTASHVGNEYAARLAAASCTPDSHKVAPRVYFHRHNYAKFIFDLGGSAVKSVAFANFRYITDDKREQDQLDLVADVPGTFIYTISDSEVARAMEQELQNEATREIVRTAAASASVHNQQFDPNSPIVPVMGAQVTVQHMRPTPGLQVVPSSQPQQHAVVGIQSSFSGTQATEALSAVATTPGSQTQSPSSTDEAVARLNALVSQAKSPSA